MPIYEYECRRCGHDFETIQRFSDKPLRKCPECGKLSLRKKISAAAFHLKGTGWYVTDFRDQGKKGAKGNGAGGKDGDRPTAGKGDGAKGDSGKGGTAKKSESKAAAG